VTFNVNPGYYNEQFVINAITGASTSSRVTFQSANGDSSSVVIGFDFNQTGNNYVVQLAGTQYLTLKGMTFRQTNSSSGRVINFTGNPSNIIIANNRLEMPVNTAGTTAAVVTLSSDFGNDNKILNNYILNGYNGIVAQGSATVSSKRNVIEGNSINGFYFYGIQAEYQDSLSIRKNSIEPSNTTASKRAIYINTPSNNLFVEKNKIKMLVTGGTMNGIYITTPVGTSTNRQYITNNFISIKGSLGYGMYISTPNFMTIAYNSLNVDLTTTGSTATALYVNGGSNNLLFNNSIVGLDSTYLLYVSANTIFTNSDNNNLYKSGGINYAYWGASAANLAALKVLSAKDSNSVAVDPDYISFADLHVYTAALNNLGKALTDITGDIDGQIRNTSTPDIGADEFAPLAIDVATVNFIEPTVTFSQSGLNMNVIVRIKNYGADSVANFNVVCKLGNAAPVSHPYTSFLHANQADTITFANQSVASGPFEIKVYISLASDLNHMNDTINTMYFGVPFKSIPYAENFDNTNEDWFVSESASLWERGIPNASVINSAHSAPNVWATNLDGNYTNGNISVLYTPIFDNSVFKADTLKFWHWEDAELNKDGGYIEYKDNTGNWSILGHIIPVDTNATNWYNGTTQNMWTGTGGGWQYSTYKLSNLNNLGNTLQFRFVFYADATNSNYNGWAIDNFELTLAPIPKDAGVTAITSPSSTSLVGDLVTISVNVKNFGTDTLTNIPVKYQVTGSGVQSGIMAGPLSPGATANFTFAQPYQVANINYTICAFTSVVGDIYIQNDNKCKTVIVNPALKDVAITEILQPGAYVTPGTTPIKVVIKNFGTLTQTSIPVSYQRGALTPVNATWTGNLTAGDTVQFTFAAPMIVPSGGSFSLCAYTSLVNDAYIHNDSICKSVIICNVATAGPITGPTTVTPGSSGNAYSITALLNATSYNWVYTPSTGVTIIGNGSSVTINFGAGAVNGVLSVNGVSTSCSGASSSINIGGLGVGIDNLDEKMLWLGQNMPNPTTGLTNIEYSLPSSGEVKFDIINLFGQKVFSSDEKLNAGKHFIDLNVNNLSAGIYYYAIEFKGKRLVKKMVVNK
ncbi:MAG: T9SS type A sorting domain-containing protein, partial [Bacteroidales bacterium]